MAKKKLACKARIRPINPEPNFTDTGMQREMQPSSDTLSEETQMLLHSLKSLYVDPVYSDWTIVCGSERFPVHRCILATRCEVLAKELEWNEKNPYKRDVRETSLPDDPVVVKKMIQYLYTGNYSAPDEEVTATTGTDAYHTEEEQPLEEPEDFPEEQPEVMEEVMDEPVPSAEMIEEVNAVENSDPPQNPDQSPSSNQSEARQSLDPPILHARIYALAHRLLIHGLKVLASKNFRESLERYLNYVSLSRVVEEVYRPISEKDDKVILDPRYQEMRDIVINVVLENLSTLRSSNVLPDDLLKNNLDFAGELCIALINKNGSTSYSNSYGGCRGWY